MTLASLFDLGAAQSWNAPLVLLLIKATLILVAALGITLAMQRASAGARHLVWLVTLVALVMMPALTAWAPLRLEILPATPAPSTVVAPKATPIVLDAPSRTIVLNAPASAPTAGVVTPAPVAASAPSHGVISALANVLPGLVRGVSDAHAGGGDVAAAQARVNAARTLVKTYASPPALKAALPWVSDLPLTSVRAPLANLSDEQAASLTQGMAEAGLI